MKTLKKVVVSVLLCWCLLVMAEGLRLVGSTNPGCYPVLYLAGTHVQNELADYRSLGFSQTYHLSEDGFVWGEFKVLGLRVARWEG